MDGAVKESIALEVMQAMGDAVIAHDDVLLLRAQKTRVTPRGRDGGVGLSGYWWQIIPIANRNGEKEIAGYWNKKTNEHLRADEKDEFIEKSKTEDGWVETYRHKLELAKDVFVIVEGNQVDLRLANLYENFTSRYRMAIDSIVDLVNRGAIQYSPKVDVNEHNKRCAMTNRIKREFKPVRYEHNLLFRDTLGQLMFEALKQVAETKSKMVVLDGSIYLQGFNKYDGLKKSVKYYDIGIRDGCESGKLYKLETTFEKGFFKAEGIKVSDMLEQTGIQEMLKSELEKTVEDVLALIVRTGEGETIMNTLREEFGYNVGTGTLKQVTHSMLSSSRTLTERVSRLESEMENVKSDVLELKRELLELKKSKK